MTEQDQLIGIYRAINQAMVAKDIAKLEELLQKETFLVHMTGYQQPVAEWLHQIASEEMRYDSWQEEAIKSIQINGNEASLIGRSRVKARIWGMGPATWTLQIHLYFQKTDGRWQVVKQVASSY